MATRCKPTPCATEASPSSSRSLPRGVSPATASFRECRELKAIQEVYDEWQEETGVKVIAISTDQAQNINKVKPLVDSYGWEYDILLDPNSDFLRAMNVKLIPHAFVIDGEGRVAYSHSGYTDGGEEELIEKVREILNSDK